MAIQTWICFTYIVNIGWIIDFDAMQNEVTFILSIVHDYFTNVVDVVVSLYNEAHQHVVAVVMMMDVAMVIVQHPYHR